VVPGPKEGHGNGQINAVSRSSVCSADSSACSRIRELSQLHPPRVFPTPAVFDDWRGCGSRVIPSDQKLVGEMIENICYKNALTTSVWKPGTCKTRRKPILPRGHGARPAEKQERQVKGKRSKTDSINFLPLDLIPKPSPIPSAVLRALRVSVVISPRSLFSSAFLKTQEYRPPASWSNPCGRRR